MPYIKQIEKWNFGEVEQLLYDNPPCNPGELNYVFTIVAKAYLNKYGTKYQHLNDIIGALEGCKLELYRRVAAPYEDKKIQENGDVY